MTKSGTHFNTCITASKQTVGGWCLGATLFFHVAEKPTEEQIKNTKVLLGWEWFDE